MYCVKPIAFYEAHVVIPASLYCFPVLIQSCDAIYFMKSDIIIMLGFK